MSDMFGLVVKFTVKPGHEEAFDELVRETLPGIQDREPGTLIYTCHRVRDAPSQWLFYELYRDREAFDTHEQEPHVRRFLAERGEHLERSEVDFLTFAAGKDLPSSSS